MTQYCVFFLADWEIWKAFEHPQNLSFTTSIKNVLFTYITQKCIHAFICAIFCSLNWI